MNYILSNHARERMRLRSIAETVLARVIGDPDSKQQQSKPPDTWKFSKVIDHRRIQLIATWLEREQSWLVISVWAKGERDPMDPLTEVVWNLLQGIGWAIASLFRLLAKLLLPR